MIKEDYVSFETAKLLEEKGFDELTDERYPIFDENKEYKYDIPCPTFQMVCEWLRQKHNLSVEVYRTACGWIGCVVAIPSGTDIKFLEEDGDDLPSGQYTEWEYACEATIKYCLEHLI